MKFLFYSTVVVQSDGTTGFTSNYNQIKARYGFTDAYIYYKSQLVLVSSLGTSFFDAFSCFINLSTECIIFEFMLNKTKQQGQYTDWQPAFASRDVVFLPFAWNSKDTVYSSNSGWLRAIDNNYYQIQQVGETPVCFMNERSQIPEVYSDYIPLVMRTLPDGILVPEKRVANGQAQDWGPQNSVVLDEPFVLDTLVITALLPCTVSIVASLGNADAGPPTVTINSSLVCTGGQNIFNWYLTACSQNIATGDIGNVKSVINSWTRGTVDISTNSFVINNDESSAYFVSPVIAITQQTPFQIITSNIDLLACNVYMLYNGNITQIKTGQPLPTTLYTPFTNYSLVFEVYPLLSSSELDTTLLELTYYSKSVRQCGVQIICDVLDSIDVVFGSKVPIIGMPIFGGDDSNISSPALPGLLSVGPQQQLVVSPGGGGPPVTTYGFGVYKAPKIPFAPIFVGLEGGGSWQSSVQDFFEYSFTGVTEEYPAALAASLVTSTPGDYFSDMYIGLVASPTPVTYGFEFSLQGITPNLDTTYDTFYYDVPPAASDPSNQKLFDGDTFYDPFTQRSQLMVGRAAESTSGGNNYVAFARPGITSQVLIGCDVSYDGTTFTFESDAPWDSSGPALWGTVGVDLSFSSPQAVEAYTYTMYFIDITNPLNNNGSAICPPRVAGPVAEWVYYRKEEYPGVTSLEVNYLFSVPTRLIVALRKTVDISIATLQADAWQCVVENQHDTFLNCILSSPNTVPNWLFTGAWANGYVIDDLFPLAPRQYLWYFNSIASKKGLMPVYDNSVNDNRLFYTYQDMITGAGNNWIVYFVIRKNQCFIKNLVL